jgi:hypothetical protein
MIRVFLDKGINGVSYLVTIIYTLDENREKFYLSH